MYEHRRLLLAVPKKINESLFVAEMKLCALRAAREQFTTTTTTTIFECGPLKIGVKSEMSSTQQYSLNFMNIPLNDDNNEECTIGKQASE